MPNTCSTPSALRHSMMASTARMAAMVLSGFRGQDWPGGQSKRKLSLTVLFSRSDRVSCAGDRLREIQVGAAAHAHLVADRDDVAALGAFPERIVLLVAVQHRRDDPNPRERGADQEPDEEGASLHPADQSGCDPEDDRDDYERQSTRSAQITAITAMTATKIQAIAATKPITSLKSTNAATTRTATASALRARSETA